MNDRNYYQPPPQGRGPPPPPYFHPDQHRPHVYGLPGRSPPRRRSRSPPRYSRSRSPRRRYYSPRRSRSFDRMDRDLYRRRPIRRRSRSRSRSYRRDFSPRRPPSREYRGRSRSREFRNRPRSSSRDRQYRNGLRSRSHSRRRMRSFSRERRLSRSRSYSMRRSRRSFSGSPSRNRSQSSGKRRERDGSMRSFSREKDVDNKNDGVGIISDNDIDKDRNRQHSGGSGGRSLSVDSGDRDRRKRKRRKERSRRDGSRDREHRRRRSDGRRRDRDSRRKRKGRGGSGGSASSRGRDDSYGHFEGGPGSIIDGRFKLIKEVGVGTFGRVVQAVDIRQKGDIKIPSRGGRDRRDRKYRIKMEDTVAIKIVRNVKRYYDSALIEAQILKDVNNQGGRGKSLCAVLLTEFDLHGHHCLVFECLGRSLYDFMKTHGFKPFPLFCVRDFARQLLDVLDFIHRMGLIHTDLKPENILLKSNKERPYRLPDGSDQQVPASTAIKLVDFGGATYDRDRKKTSIINTRQYRAPEVILGLGWSIPSDLWSAGCIIAELYKGELLFATHDNVEHLALIEKIIGRFPIRMIEDSKEFGPVFDREGWHKLDLSSSSKEHVRKNVDLQTMVKEKDQASGIVSLLESLLSIDPDQRASASDGLKSSFFSEVADVQSNA